MAKKKAKEPDRVLIAGKPDLDRCDNKVISARYTALNFLPVVSRLVADWMDTIVSIL
jgi:hypothetical protein